MFLLGDIDVVCYFGVFVEVDGFFEFVGVVVEESVFGGCKLGFVGWG